MQIHTIPETVQQNRSNRGHKFRFMGNGYQLTRAMRAFSLSLKAVIEFFDIILLIIHSVLKWVDTVFCYFEEMNVCYCFSPSVLVLFNFR
jgi:hypothetical protein